MIFRPSLLSRRGSQTHRQCWSGSLGLSVPSLFAILGEMLGIPSFLPLIGGPRALPLDDIGVVLQACYARDVDEHLCVISTASLCIEKQQIQNV